MYIKVISESEQIFPYDLKNLKKDNPDTIFPVHLTERFLESIGIFKVREIKPSTINYLTEKLLITKNPVKTEKGWEINYTKVLLSEEEKNEQKYLETRRLLVKRNIALKNTDWYVIRKLEIGMDIPSEILSYRQALRDITLAENFPYVQLPIFPENFAHDIIYTSEDITLESTEAADNND